MNNSDKNLSKGIKIALLGAMASILMFFDFPIIPAFSWLKIDLSEIPVLIGAFAFGPISGIIIEGLKIVLYVIIKGTHTGFVGELANFIVGISLVVPAALIYHRKKSKTGAVIGMIVGTLVMEVSGIIANLYLLIPAYGITINTQKYVLYGLLPFNGVKALIVCVLTFILYKKLSVSLFKNEIAFNKKEMSNS